jgi:hypothetical protein
MLETRRPVALKDLFIQSRYSFLVKGAADGGKELLISSKSEYKKSAHLQMGEKN